MSAVRSPAVRVVACPYCRAEVRAQCWHVEPHAIVETCASCLGTLVIRFEVQVKAVPLTVEGELDRVEDELEEKLQHERARNEAAAAGAR